MTSRDCCVFCLRERQGGIGLCDTVLYETDGVVVTPTLGSLLSGWVLVTPIEHALSGAMLSHPRRFALGRAMEVARRRLIDTYGRATLFEHGPATTGAVVGCTVDHVHIHAAPVPFALADVSMQSSVGRRLHWKLYQSWEEIWDSLRSTDYVAVSSSDGVWAAIGDIPSQFFRRIIANELKLPSFDWRADPGDAFIRQTIQAWNSKGANMEQECSSAA